MKVLTRYIFTILFFLVLVSGMFFLTKAASAPENEDTIMRTLEGNGFSDVEIIKKSVVIVKWGESDPGRENIVEFTATAKNSEGKKVEIHVSRRLLGMP